MTLVDFKAFMQEVDWKGTITLTWTLGFMALLGYNVVVGDYAGFEQVAATLGTATGLIIQYWFGKD